MMQIYTLPYHTIHAFSVITGIVIKFQFHSCSQQRMQNTYQINALPYIGGDTNITFRYTNRI